MLTAANHENSETARLVTVLVLGSLLLTLLCREKITKKKIISPLISTIIITPQLQIKPLMCSSDV